MAFGKTKYKVLNIKMLSTVYFFLFHLCRPRCWIFFSIFFRRIHPLVVESEVEVGRIEVVQANVAVLAAASVRLAVRVECQRVDGPKVTLDAAELLLKDQVEETSVELADARRRRRHVHRLLATTDHHLH